MIPNRLATLGHPQRLALFRLLMRRYPDRVPATELADALGLKPNTLSTYVAALMQVGLITQERVGTSRRYSVRMDATRETLDFLLHDCCRGRPDLCMPQTVAAMDKASTAPQPKHTVLFLCTGNSARSIFAESILRSVAGDRFIAHSAGTKPRAGPNPHALDVLRQNDHDIAGLRAKDVSVFQGADAPTFDFVFTVCNQAANEDCPAWAGHPVSAHWGIPDPAAAGGTTADITAAFQQAYTALLRRITAFAALPLATLDQVTLQRSIDTIATLEN